MFFKEDARLLRELGCVCVCVCVCVNTIAFLEGDW